ncbi:MAG: dihydrofolate reductase family protein [Anaerolineales bacterium]|nr:dihydrofolate reductase family protein [Anaerolineales bacterium]
MKPILTLYPPPTAERPLVNTYLNHQIRAKAQQQARPFVYTNYVVSLDGRIAIAHPKQGMMVPQSTANKRDWRLFQELAHQADVLISSGRYLRDVADGRAQEILNTDDPNFADLRTWRKEQGLPQHPDIVIVSSSLDFPIPKQLATNGRKVIIFTTADSNPQRRAELKAQAGQVYISGEKQVEGQKMITQLDKLGYQVIYNTSGPKIFQMLLAAGVVDRLYLTHVNRLLGGNPFSPVVEGALLEPPVDLKLNTLNYDPHAPDGLGQLFISYDVVRTP